MGFSLDAIPAFALTVATDPEAARTRILAAIRDARGDPAAAATSLGISLRSWHRYVQTLGVRPAVSEILAEHERQPGHGLRPAQRAK